MLLEARHLIEPIHCGCPTTMPQKAGDVLLAAQLGAGGWSVFRRNADQLLNDPDQAIAIRLHILIELFVFE
jgi:hypothetical protein